MTSQGFIEEARWTYTSENGIEVECWIYLLSYGRTWRTGYVRLPLGIDPDFDTNRINVHGGVTYDKNGVIGFDTAHGGDNVETWTHEVVRTEVEHMAEQVTQHVSVLINLAHTMEDK